MHALPVTQGVGRHLTITRSVFAERRFVIRTNPCTGAWAQITALASALGTYLLCHLFFSFSVSDSRQQNLIRAFSPMPINSNPIPPQGRKDEENNYDIPGIKSLVMSVSLLWKYDLLRYKLWDLLSVCSHVITAVVFTGSHFVQRLSANWSSMS